MGSNIFDSILGNQESVHEKEEERRSFDMSMRRAVSWLMQCKEGRVFLRWLGRGASPQAILQLILDYEEEKYV